MFARPMQNLHLIMSRNEKRLTLRHYAWTRLRKNICVERDKNSLDIFNIKKIWGVLVMIIFGPDITVSAPFADVLRSARPSD